MYVCLCVFVYTKVALAHLSGVDAKQLCQKYVCEKYEKRVVTMIYLICTLNQHSSKQAHFTCRRSCRFLQCKACHACLCVCMCVRVCRADASAHIHFGIAAVNFVWKLSEFFISKTFFFAAPRHFCFIFAVTEILSLHFFCCSTEIA